MTASGPGDRGALAGLRVVDLTDQKGVYCTKLLADLGADVVRVEPPGGSEIRRWEPFLRDTPHVEGSLLHLYYNSNKRSVTIDYSEEEGRKLLERLAATADVVVETLPPGRLDSLGLGYGALSAHNPGLVLTSITPYGQWGPYSGYRGSDLSGQAMGGAMSVVGDPARAPVRAAGYCGTHMASYVAAVATMAAVHFRDESGLGQHVDVSVQEAVAAQMEFFSPDYLFTGFVAKRQGTHHPNAYPVTLYPARDGWFSLCAGSEPAWAALCDWIGDERLRDERFFTDPEAKTAAMGLLDSIFTSFGRDKDRLELFHEGQRRRITISACLRPDEVVADPHLNERGYFVELDHPYAGRLKFPGPPYELHGTPWRLRRPAPLLGEHDDEVRAELTGQPPAHASAAWPAPVARSGRDASSTLPLAGLRVLECAVVMAGPITGKLLADLGAEVYKVEAGPTLGMRGTGPWLNGVNTAPDGAGRFTLFNRNKRSITLNLKTDEGHELFRRLVAVSDVVIDNFSAGTMAELGLSYEVLSQINPGIIMIELSGFGQTGPYRAYVSAGPTLQALYGHPELTGYPEGEPAQVGFTISDFMSPYHAAFALLAALRHRRETGLGQYIDAGQLQLGAALTGVAQLDYSANGRVQTRRGNDEPNALLHGCYPCTGDDRWCVIAVWTEEEWRLLCRVLGDPDWSRDPQLATAEGRASRTAEIDRHIKEWTSSRRADDVMGQLQAVGVEAAKVQDMADLIDGDPHLAARGFYETYEHLTGETVRIDGIPFKLSRTPGSVRSGAPILGIDNDYACREVLGLDDETIAAYTAAGVLG